MKTTNYCKFLWITTLFISFLTLTNCAKIEDISLISVPEDINVNNVDTFKVELSTLLLDPLPTASTGSIMVGGYKDDFCGTTKFQSYFKLSMPNLSSEFEENIRYDSVTMVLKYSGYYYGDTTKTMTLSLHQLNESIEKTKLPTALEGDEYPVFVSGDVLFADQKFNYDQTALSSIKFSPRPRSTSDTVAFRVNQEFGKELYDLAINKDAKLTNLTEYEEYLRGFTIKANDDASAVIGFRDTISLVVHYSHEDQKNGERISEQIEFKLSERDYQFNAIQTDRTGTVLQALNDQNNELFPSQSGNRTFMQASSGIGTRLKFPTIRNSIGDGTVSVNNATLIIETDQTNTLSPAIDTLIIMKANRYGTPTSLLTNSSGYNIVAPYYKNSNTSTVSNGRYAFDLTDYISNLLKSKTYDENESLILAPQIQDLLSTMETLHVATEDNRPAIKLNITYTKTQ